MSNAKTYDSFSIGKRKTSVARVYFKAGSGQIKINNRKFNEYFPNATDRYVATQPLELLKMSEEYDLVINVKGGGMSGQAGAIRLGVARSILKVLPDRKEELRQAGFLTRDSRIVERKKYGRRGARRSFQFSKR